jgi:hypothetical protein
MDKFFILLLIAALAAGCKKDKEDPATPGTPPVNEEEVITTVKLTFTDTETSEVFELRWADADGDGGNAPVITGDTLEIARTYDVAVSVLNESVDPVEDITAEIAAEDEEHQFFYTVNGAELTIDYADGDGNGKPVGLLCAGTTGAAGNGSLTLKLVHEPDKDAPGVADGDPTNAGGETDIEVTFPVVIE